MRWDPWDAIMKWDFGMMGWDDPKGFFQPKPFQDFSCSQFPRFPSLFGISSQSWPQLWDVLTERILHFPSIFCHQVPALESPKPGFSAFPKLSQPLCLHSLEGKIPKISPCSYSGCSVRERTGRKLGERVGNLFGGKKTRRDKRWEFSGGKNQGESSRETGRASWNIHWESFEEKIKSKQKKNRERPAGSWSIHQAFFGNKTGKSSWGSWQEEAEGSG